MKKLLSIILAAMLIASLAACDSGGETQITQPAQSITYSEDTERYRGMSDKSTSVAVLERKLNRKKQMGVIS